jgi:hypothetical protein
MIKNQNNNFQTVLVIYNLAILAMFLFFIFKAQTGLNFIFIGLILFFANLILPSIIFLRQQSWGKYATPYEEQFISPISKGLRDFKKSSTLERLFALSYVFWLFFALLITLYGWLIS